MHMFSSISWFLCAVAFVDAASLQAGTTVTVKRPAHPILIRNEHGPLLRVTLEIDGPEPVRLDSLEFSLAGCDDLEDIEELKLYSTSEKDEFSTVEMIGQPVEPRQTWSVPINRELAVGKHVFWLDARLKAAANLQHRIVAKCQSVVTSAGSIQPPDDNACSSQRIGIALRKHNDDGVHTHRIPALTTSPKGTLLVVYDLRRRMGRDLQEDIDIGLSRSTDGGQTWESPQVIMDMGEYGGLPQAQNGCSDPGIIVDQQTGEIFCFALWMNGKTGKHQWVDDGSEPGFEVGKAAQFLMVRSKDDGRTWSSPENLTRQLKQESWWLLAPSPQSGFCMPDGTLVMPVQGRTGRDKMETFATIMLSSDHGKTWTVGAHGYKGGNECQAALLSNGHIMLNVRNDRERFRAVVITEDLGKTWYNHPTNRHALIEPNCNGSLLSLNDKRVLLFSNPHSQTARTHQTIQVSFDDGNSWPESHHWLLDEGRGAGYPSLTRIDQEYIGIVYEGSQANLVFEKLPIKKILDPTLRQVLND